MDEVKGELVCSKSKSGMCLLMCEGFEPCMDECELGGPQLANDTVPCKRMRVKATGKRIWRGSGVW